MSFYSGIYKLLGPAVRRIYRINVVGKNNLPDEGMILAANHTAFSDVLVISAAADRQVHYMAKKELFKIPVLAPLIRALGAYPVDRGGADVQSIKNTISLINNGEIIGIFPQGHRHGGENPRETEIKGGIGMIAYRSKSGVIPVFIHNKRMRTGIFRKNTVVFGDYIPYEELGFEKGGSVEYNECAHRVFDRICSLNPDETGILSEGKIPPKLTDGKK